MVDMTSFEQAGRNRIDGGVTRVAESKSSSFTTIVYGSNAVSTAYEGLPPEAVHAPPQSLAWVRAWSTEVNSDLAVVVAQSHGRTVFVLPLEVVDRGPMRIARFAGGSHANGNFAATSPSFAKTADAGAIRGLMDVLHKSRPDIDLVSLDRQLE